MVQSGMIIGSWSQKLTLITAQKYVKLLIKCIFPPKMKHCHLTFIYIHTTNHMHCRKMFQYSIQGWDMLKSNNGSTRKNRRKQAELIDKVKNKFILKKRN